MLERRETPPAQVLQSWRVAPPPFTEPSTPLQYFERLLSVPQLPVPAVISGEYEGEKPDPHQRIRERYDALLAQCQTRLDALPLQSGEAPSSDDESETPSSEVVEQVYDTGIGRVTFAELYAKTSRIVGASLRDMYQLTHPEDVDDCIQSGYFKVWQRLQKTPDLFKDKPKRYIVRAILFRSKAQRFSHNRHYRKIVWDAEPERPANRADDFNARRADTWIDLAQALATVVHQIGEDRVTLLGLYCLITQATTQDVAKVFGHGQWTLCKAKKRVAAMLAGQLPDYNPSGRRAVLSSKQPTANPVTVSSMNAPLVMGSLFEGIERHLDEEKIRHNATGNTVLRQMVADYEHAPGVFPTGWGRALTLEEIVADRQILNIAHSKAMRLGLHDEDKDDCVQQGIIRLWQRLKTNPYLLADKNRMWTGVCIAYGGDTYKFRRHNQRYTPVGDNAFLLEGEGETWTESVDEQLDMAQFVQSVAARYADEPDKLLAFYALATSVKIRDVAPILGISANVFAMRIGHSVRAEVREMLAGER